MTSGAGAVLLRENPLAGQSTLNRLELGGPVPSRYKKIHYREEAIDELLAKVLLEAHAETPEQTARLAADGGSGRGGGQQRRVGAAPGAATA